METIDDVLHQFYEVEKIPNKRNFITASFLYSFHNIISIYLFVLSLQIAGVDTSHIFLQGVFLLQLFIFRALPIMALLLFLWRKKAGWALVFFFSVYDWLQKLYFSVDAIVRFNKYHLINQFLHWGVFLTFVLSGILIVLLLLKDVRRLFYITPRVMLFTIIISVVWFSFIRFYLSALLINHLHAK